MKWKKIENKIENKYKCFIFNIIIYNVCEYFKSNFYKKSKD